MPRPAAPLHVLHLHWGSLQRNSPRKYVHPFRDVIHHAIYINSSPSIFFTCNHQEIFASAKSVMVCFLTEKPHSYSCFSFYGSFWGHLRACSSIPTVQALTSHRSASQLQDFCMILKGPPCVSFDHLPFQVCVFSGCNLSVFKPFLLVVEMPGSLISPQIKTTGRQTTYLWLDHLPQSGKSALSVTSLCPDALNLWFKDRNAPQVLRPLLSYLTQVLFLRPMA